MIAIRLDDLVDVSHYYTTPDRVPLAHLAPLPDGDIVHRDGPRRFVVVLRTAQGDRVEVQLDGVVGATQLREVAATARRWYLDEAERALAE